MEYRNLGNSGLKVSLVGLGCNNFGARADFEQTRAVVHQALDEGITLIDTADVYGEQKSEEFLGRILQTRRHDVVIATKFGLPTGEGPYKRGGSRRYAMLSLEGSLRRLNTDYIDLYQIHRPDPETPIEETLEAMTDMVRSGKVRYIGCSNYAGWQLAEALMTSRARGLAPFVSAQNEYSLVERHVEQELLPACRHFNVGVLPFFPLASGLLTGKYQAGGELPKDSRLAKSAPLRQRTMTERNLAILERISRFVSASGHPMLELAFSWLANQPQVASVIAGAMTPEQIKANVRAAGWKLSAEELAEVDKATRV
jgi:aryl-alcohol dehydrogenase-like predicted oxidoreductase